MESSERELSSDAWFYYAQINSRKVTAHFAVFFTALQKFVLPEIFDTDRKINRNFAAVDQSMVKVYIFGKLLSRAFQ